MNAVKVVWKGEVDADVMGITQAPAGLVKLGPESEIQHRPALNHWVSMSQSSIPRWQRKVKEYHLKLRVIANALALSSAKSRTISVRLISMAMTGYYRTFVRPRTSRPLSMLKYDPVGTFKLKSYRIESDGYMATRSLIALTDLDVTVRKRVLFLEQKKSAKR